MGVRKKILNGTILFETCTAVTQLYSCDTAVLHVGHDVGSTRVLCILFVCIIRF